MNIRLTDDYKLVTDPHNYVLQKRNVVQDKESENYGKETWNSIGWYARLEYLVNKLIELEIKQSDVTQMKELIAVVRDVESNIVGKLEGIV
jgi:hypothetical protein